MAETKLQVKNLQVSFRTQGGILKAVRNISFDLQTGETLAIVGESGSGKSVTSKAIIGILAGNSIVEGGEILYDGQDLLKIDEESFHKIRGDKISMIFQDPLSSLNPIMRVGKQLTEAMILNGKARQRSSKKEFNSHLSLLNQRLNELNGNKANNDLQCKTFDSFCINSTKLEREYNAAVANLTTLRTELEETSFLLEHKQKVDVKAKCRLLLTLIKKAEHKFVVSEDEEYAACANGLNEILALEGKIDDEEKIAYALERLTKLDAYLEVCSKKEHPDFFRLGYYKFVNPNFDEASMPVKELDEMTLKFLDDNFMKEFIKLVETGLQYAFEQTLERKKVCYEQLKLFLEYLNSNESYVKGDIVEHYRVTKALVNDAINHLEIIKKSAEYSYGISLNHEIKRYFFGIKHNPKATRKYEKQKAKYDALVEKGKQPTWQVIPPYLVDLELTRNNMIKIVSDLIAHYENEIANAHLYDSNKEMYDLIDFFKEQASRLVYRVTKGIAKTRALELLKEVGIPEPAIRYKQYPFEFSGGMRQRIVIAIALSANPDILICDEPTTALDVTIQSQILELINKIKKERNLSVIFITHDLGVVANMADRIAVMYAGKIVEYGTSEDILYDPKHPYTWALLASMPDLETKEKLEAIPGTPPNMIYPPKGDAFAERNKYALEIDYELEPPLFEVSPTHYAATWLLHPNAPKVEPPKIIQERIARMKKEADEL